MAEDIAMTLLIGVALWVILKSGPRATDKTRFDPMLRGAVWGTAFVVIIICVALLTSCSSIEIQPVDLSEIPCAELEARYDNMVAPYDERVWAGDREGAMLDWAQDSTIQRVLGELGSHRCLHATPQGIVR